MNRVLITADPYRQIARIADGAIGCRKGDPSADSRPSKSGLARSPTNITRAQTALQHITEMSAAARRYAASAYQQKISNAITRAYRPARAAYPSYISARYGRESGETDTANFDVARAEVEFREARPAVAPHCVLRLLRRRAKHGLGALERVDPTAVQVLAQTLSLACV